MAPSRLHEDLTEILDRIVDAAGSAVADAVKGLRSTRLRGRDDPPGTGMEPDCAFYVGERAKGYYGACAEGEAAVESFVERIAPDLVVETEITSFDEGKIARYGDLGVRELWRLYGCKGSDELRVDFLAVRCRERASQARCLADSHGAHAGRRVRSGGKGAVRPDPGRAGGGGVADRAAAPAGDCARSRRGGALFRKPPPDGERTGRAWVSSGNPAASQSLTGTP